MIHIPVDGLMPLNLLTGCRRNMLCDFKLSRPKLEIVREKWCNLVHQKRWSYSTVRQPTTKLELQLLKTASASISHIYKPTNQNLM